VRIDGVDLGAGVGAWFTGRDPDAADPPVGQLGNLSHRRPHRPEDLAAARARVGEATGTDPATWHLMQQVHGARVAEVTAATPAGAELRGFDGVVTAETDRPLVALAADCVPVLFAGDGVVGAAHAGRLGVVRGVVPAVLTALGDLGASPPDLTVAVGPAIGSCCYEVPAGMRADVAAQHPVAAAETTWGTPSLDLPGAVVAVLEDAGVGDVRSSPVCTSCHPEWFSHRRDPGSGRHAGVVVRRGAAAVADAPVTTAEAS
jgi:polyphenol oxidase